MPTEPRAEHIAPPNRQTAADVTEAELQAFRATAATIDEDEWVRPTESAGWTVRDMIAHVAGQYEELASLPTFLRRLRTARRRYPQRIVLDGHNQVQIDELGRWSKRVLIAHLDRYGPAGLKAVRRMPGLVRRLPSTLFFPEPPLPDRRLSYLFDVLASRDTWMHRVELTRATGTELVHHGHEAAIVAQIVRDLATAWTGPALLLALTGPIGGAWTLGDGQVEERIEADAVLVMLHLSGRGGLDLPTTSMLAGARVVF